MVDIKKHFNDFYERLIYLDKDVGYNEKTFQTDVGYTYTEHNDKLLICTFHEEQLNDRRVFLRVPGIQLILTYGEWYNKKYSEINLSIFKDEKYDGEVVSVTKALQTLNEYINNTYKEYNERINRQIYKNTGEKIKVEYKQSNILDFNNLKNVTIRDLTLTTEDLVSLQKYKKLFVLTTINCNINADLSNLKVQLYSDTHSTFDSLNQFNNSSINCIVLNASTFTNPTFTNLNMNIRSLSFYDVNINYELFFLMSNLRNLIDLKIEGYELKPDEVELLRNFYELNELTCSGSCYSLKFLDFLNNLEFFQGYMELIDDRYFDYLKRLNKEKYDVYKENYDDEYVKRVFVNQRLNDTNRHKIIANLLIDRIAQTKWQGKIASASDEEISDYLKYVATLPIAQRQKIGKKENIFFVDTNISDYYKILGIELIPQVDEFQTKIIGPYGSPLYRHSSFGDIKKAPIFDAKGHVSYEIEYRTEKDVTIPEFYIGHKNEIVENTNNVFDYYYNRQYSEEQKVEYLISLIKDSPLLTDSFSYKERLSEREQILKRLKELHNKKYTCDHLLYIMPSHNYEVITAIENGEEYKTFKIVEDPYISEDDLSLFSILKRHRSYESVKRMVEEEFKNEKTPLDEQQEIIQSIIALIDDLNEIDELKAKLIDFDALVETILYDKYSELFESLFKEKFLTYYEQDINNFLSRYNLTDIEYNFMFIYILLKQSILTDKFNRAIYDINGKIDDMYERKSISYLLEKYDFESKELDEIEDIDELDMLVMKTWFELLDDKAQLKSLLNKGIKEKREKTYEEMIPLIDKLSTEELAVIKANIPIIDEYQDKFAKIVDYLYYYFNDDYPEWIKLELFKRPKLDSKFVSSMDVKKIEEHQVHIKGYSKLQRR